MSRHTSHLTNMCSWLMAAVGQPRTQSPILIGLSTSPMGPSSVAFKLSTVAKLPFGPFLALMMAIRAMWKWSLISKIQLSFFSTFSAHPTMAPDRCMWSLRTSTRHIPIRVCMQHPVAPVLSFSTSACLLGVQCSFSRVYTLLLWKRSQWLIQYSISCSKSSSHKKCSTYHHSVCDAQSKTWGKCTRLTSKSGFYYTHKIF